MKKKLLSLLLALTAPALAAETAAAIKLSKSSGKSQTIDQAQRPSQLGTASVLACEGMTG